MDSSPKEDGPGQEGHPYSSGGGADKENTGPHRNANGPAPVNPCDKKIAQSNGSPNRLYNLPQELRDLKIWACSTADGKAPLMPDGRAAKVNDPSTWSSFEQCEAAIGKPGIASIGAMVSADNPYTCIDLDQDGPVEQRILDAFNSYTERSRSGRGYHIWIRGKKKLGSKSRRDKVEVYDHSRYIICTGDVVNPSPITEQQGMLDLLCEEIGIDSGDPFDIPDGDESCKDATVMEICSKSHNGNWFDDLCKGDWQKYPDRYPSQSEADLALIQRFASVTKSNSQVEQLFFGSGLSKRAKAHRKDYFLRTLARARALLAKDREREDAKAVPSGVPLTSPQVAAQPHVDTTFPPGLVGEVAQYIYDSAYLQAAPIALAGALTLFAGICGRTYNVDGDGLNLYIVVLARTGRGKESAQDGVMSLIYAIARAGAPMVMHFIGPDFSSGQALHRKLTEQPHVFFSLLGEIGQHLRALAGDKANSAEIQLVRMLLIAWSKSGKNKFVTGKSYSDTEKNIKAVQSPAITFLGESNQTTFFNAIDFESISEGLIPRFLVIEHKGDVPPKNPQYEMPPPDHLVERLKTLVNTLMRALESHSVCDITVDESARAIFDAFDEEKRSVLNAAQENTPEEELWNRAVQMAKRIAGLIAVGVNQENPIITTVEATWAVKFVKQRLLRLIAHFKHGDVGQGDYAQVEKVAELVDKFYSEKLTDTWLTDPRNKNVVKSKAKGWVHRRYLQVSTSSLAAFKHERLGRKAALERAIDELVKQGSLHPVSPSQMEDAGISGQAWSRK